MALTKGQKDALTRKVQAIVDNAKIEASRAFVGKWEPNEDASKFLEEFKELSEAQRKFLSLRNELSVSHSYYSSNYAFGRYDISISNESEDMYKDMMRELCRKDTDEYICSLNLPSFQDILDDIELQSLDKDFDLEGFINKYKDICTF